MIQKLTRIFFLLLTLSLFVVLSAQTQDWHKADSIRNLLTKAGTDTTRINLLLELAEIQIFKPGEFKVDLDSAMEFVNKAKQINAVSRSSVCEGSIVLTESFIVKERGNPARGKELIERAVEILSRNSDIYKLGRAKMELSWYYDHTDSSQILQKIMLMEQAIDLFHQSHHRLDEAEARRHLAGIHMLQGKLEQAESELLPVIEEYKVIGYKNLQYPYDLLAEVYYRMGDQPKELRYRLLALEYTEANNSEALDKYWRYLSLGNLYEQLGQYQREWYWIDKVLHANKGITGDQLFYSAVMYGLNALVNQAKFKEAGEYLKKYRYNGTPSNFAGIYYNQAMGNYYSALRRYSIAEPFFLRSIDFYDKEDKKHQKKYLYAQAAYTVGHFYILAKVFSKAGQYLREIADYPNEIVMPIQKSKIQFELYQIDSAAGNYLSAIKHYQLHQNINDSLYSVAKSRQLSEMQVKYETREKEQQLKSVHSQFQMEQIKVQKASAQRNLMMVGIFMLMVIAALAYNGYRQKKISNHEMLKSNQVISHKNDQLQRVINEKEWLIKEVHHRVKNNLQIIISLLNTQSNYLDSDAAVKAIRESQQRMSAISLIHQKLYKSENAALINIKEYVYELVEHIRNSLNRSSGIVFDLDIVARQIDVEQAVPLGLILNEAICNSVKYAFKGQTTGQIKISITHSSVNNGYLLIVSDNGNGLPQNYDLSEKKSFGIRLMQGLSKQLKGSFRIENDNGVKITVEFEGSEIIKLFEQKNKLEAVA